MTDSVFFNKIVTPDTNDVNNWYQMFTEMGLMAYDTTTLISSDSLFNIAWPHIQRDTFPIGIMDLKYNLLKPGVLDTNTWFDFDTTANTVADNPLRPTSPYESIQNTFAASTLYPEYDHGDPVFLVSPKFIFADAVTGCNTCGKLAGILKINFDDGSGWHIFNPDSTTYFQANYTTAGEKIIKCGSV